MKKTVLILGATSAIAKEASAAFAKRGYSLYLAARHDEELPRIAQDLQVRYNIPVSFGHFDGEDMSSHLEFLQEVNRKTGGLQGVLLSFGCLGDEEEARHDFAKTQKLLNCNLIGACSILTECANYFESQGFGFISALSSVAGDRGRQSNYVYGTAKGGLNIFLQGLRNRLHPHNVQVTTIKPGFVDTPMTFGKPGMFLVASPKVVGEGIVRAIEKKRNVVYLPWFWAGIMALVKAIPESIFKRLKL